jgi:hypothetical protein
MSNEKQITAVEQFIEQIEEQGHSWENASIKTIEISIKVEDYLKLKQQAKEMEKGQMCKFAYKCHNHYKVYGDFNIEHFYNETYGGNK